MQIENSEPRACFLPDGTLLKPGLTEVDDHRWAASQRHPVIVAMVKTGSLREIHLTAHEPVTTGASSGSSDDLSSLARHSSFPVEIPSTQAPQVILDAQSHKTDRAVAKAECNALKAMSFREAIANVENTVDLALLRAWQGVETRSRVQETISAQIAVVSH